MKSSLKIIVAALALATAGGAFAQQTSPNTVTGTDVYFYAYDSNQSVNSSFLIDLGSNYSNFNSNVSTGNIAISGNTAYQAFLKTLTDGTVANPTANVVWGVIAAQDNPLAGAQQGQFQVGYDITSDVAVTPSQKQTSVSTQATVFGLLMTNLGTTNTLAGFESAGPVVQNIGSAVASGTGSLTTPFTSNGSIGTAASFVQYSFTGVPARTPTAPTTLAGNWTFDGSNLAYTVASVTPVPEPTSYMMMLGGLLMMGALAVRRRNSK